jgi:hypothetical protein
VALNIWKRIRRGFRVSVSLGGLTFALAQTPTLTLDKYQFFPDESVRFWIGVSATDPIPESMWESGAVHIVRPDGSKLDQHVSAPIDGNRSLSYKGGWGLGPGPHPLGKYRVSFEYAAKKTEEQILEIVPNPFAGGVQAYWVFNQSSSAVLLVENHTDRMVRFAEPGLMGSEISIGVSQDQPRSSDQRFVPESAISPPHMTPQYSFDNLDWTNISRWPMVLVPPGQSVERTIALAAAFPFRNHREYDVRLSYVLTLFIGESSDPEAALFPERRAVVGDSRLRR